MSPEPLPLSAAQERLWFLEQLVPGTAAYNVPFAWRVQGLLDTSALIRATEYVAARHQALRARFPSVDGRLMQLFDAPPLEVAFVEASGQETGPALQDFATHGFDLELGPLIRARLMRTASDEHVFILVMHHSVTDAWSVRIMTEEISACYTAARSGRPFELPPPVQYGDFVAEEQRHQSGDQYAADLNYWRRELEGATATELFVAPELFAHVAPRRTLSFSGGRISVPLAVRGDALMAAARDLRASDFMYWLSGTLLAIARHSSSLDVIVGMPVAGRGPPQYERTVGLLMNTLAVRFRLNSRLTFADHVVRVRDTLLEALEHERVPFERVVEELQVEREVTRNPLFEIFITVQEEAGFAIPGLEVSRIDVETGTSKFDLGLTFAPGSSRMSASYRAEAYPPDLVSDVLEHINNTLAEATAAPHTRLYKIDMLSARERERERAAATSALPPAIHSRSWLARIEDRIAEVPGAIAVESRDQVLTYGDLGSISASVAAKLHASGVSYGDVVAVALARTASLIPVLLGVLRAGAAYVPVDPEWPPARREYVVRDSGARIVIMDLEFGTSPAPRVVLSDLLSKPEVRLSPAQRSLEDASYVIYTSGSTGRPKGVTVTDGNVSAFCDAHDMRFPLAADARVLATTSVTFDISVLELFWPLTRGARVVLVADPFELAEPQQTHDRAKSLSLSLFYFANDDAGDAADRYRLLIDGARFADANDFEAVWTPERHFHEFGGLFPNPAVTSAALALITARVGLRAGSVVLPLQDPVRVAEEWAVVDNLSGGRAGVSFASGWQPDDFVLAAANYQDRRRVMREGIEIVRRLWQGEAISREGPRGPVQVRTRPRPIQAELPVWVTAAATPETFSFAGEIGANLLTHLLGQDLDQLARNLDLYRRAHRGQPRVTLMLHAYVDEDETQVRGTIREPFLRYLRSALDLVGGLIRSESGTDLRDLTPADLEALLASVFERHYKRSGLLGTPADVRERLGVLTDLGVQEFACLVDFGVSHDLVMRSLGRLAAGARSLSRRGRGPDLLDGVTHFQCTPTLLRALLVQRGPEVLNTVPVLLVGGETLPTDLAEYLSARPSPAYNMYGPTETTVWSSAGEIADPSVHVGEPLNGEAIYVLNADATPLPPYVAGELFVAGAGVARGYHARPRLTAERFLPDPFGSAGQRMYRTGDLGYRDREGRLHVTGRVDAQVKVRGHRVELGEIESVLREAPGVQDAAVVVRDDQFTAFVTARRTRPSLSAPQRPANDTPAGLALIDLEPDRPVAHNSVRHAEAAYREIFAHDLYFREGILLEGEQPTVLDVGANIGLFSLRCLAVSPRARILAFEPIPVTFGALRWNLEHYGSSNALAIQRGVGEKYGAEEFAYYPRLPGFSTMTRYAPEQRRRALQLIASRGRPLAMSSAESADLVTVQYQDQRLTAEVTTLSAVIREHRLERIDLLKIDVEGAELEVLQGLRQEDWPRIRQVVLETDDSQTAERLRGLLAAAGFLVHAAPIALLDPHAEGLNSVMLYAWRPEAEGRPTDRLAVGDLRAFLRASLPDYMIPAQILELPALPQTTSGKIDRARLSAEAPIEIGSAVVPPVGPMERRIAAVWSEVLGHRSIDASATFFDQGGSSIMLVQVHRRLREFAPTLRLADLFRFPTVRTLAAWLQQGAEDDVRTVAEERGRLRRSASRGVPNNTT